MRYIRYAVLLVIALALIIVSFANRGIVELRLLPADLLPPGATNWTLQIPLFLVILGAVVVGLVLGFIWEWLREHKHRSAAARNSRESAKLKRQMARMKEGEVQSTDEVVALLDTSKKPAANEPSASRAVATR